MPRRYDAHKKAAAERQRRLSTAGRDIGPLPPIRDPERRAEGSRDLAFFGREYFPDICCLPPGPCHYQACRRLAGAATNGGLFAFAMPRGFGKTTWSWLTAVWALLRGLRPFVALIGADEPAAVQLLDSIKMAFAHNDRLLDDYPEVCYPIRRLDGISQRARGQLYRGEPTALIWTGHKITLPTIAGSRASGATVRTAGLTGQIRGMAHTTADGRTIRPSFVILDDPQTDESARSPAQTQARHEIIQGAVLALGGPGTSIAAAMPCTVIKPDDLASRYLDRRAMPEWHGQRTPAVISWPTNDNLWGEYSRLRTEDLAAGGDGASADAYYLTHREEMDAGAEVSWEHYRQGCHSAIQLHWNLRLRNPAAHAAEYQNAPIDSTDGAEAITAKAILERPAGAYERGALPTLRQTLARLTASIDVHDNLLYWHVLASSTDLTAGLVDWGAWPDQKREYWTLDDATRTLKRKYPGRGKDGAIVAGLTDLLNSLLARTWELDGSQHRVDLCLVDLGYKPDEVELAIAQCNAPAAVIGSKGLPVKATNKPLSEYTKHPGDRVGHYWRSAKPPKRSRRQIQFDANAWKSIVARALTTAPGDPGALHLPTGNLRLLADHYAAEYPLRVTARGRTLDEWQLRPGRDNHFWDALVLCFVAAGVKGARPAALASGKKPSRKKRKVHYL
ncbi:MAG: hypothetical protein GX547_16415 [Phycisphaerae bacterium]|nr:hypothetical protein [Phycisphaerae bacterium]